AATNHRGHTTGEGLFNLLRGNEVNVGVNAARRHDVAFAGNDFRAGANDDVNPGLRVGVACFANGSNAPTFEPNVGFDNAPVVHDQRIGQHRIHGTLFSAALTLCHAVANGFAAAKLHFFAIATCGQGEVFFN